MSKLNIDQKTIKSLFEDRKANFLIPDYQRPYAWGELECNVLWDDIYEFAFPDNDYSKFDTENNEYFLGPIVTFINESDKKEIIDGQQRVTTLMLLLRAFYEKFKYMEDTDTKSTREIIEKCIWQTDEFGNANKEVLKIDSEVATDEDKNDFIEILKNGEINKNSKSMYAKNYRLFQDKINEFINRSPSVFKYLPARILNNCILLPIEAESQDTALRIFSTLNDRGKPLADADIFKAQFYKYYVKLNKKQYFIGEWKKLEEKCTKLFERNYENPMDEIFTRYMYYERAKQKIKSTTTESLRKFYEKDSYKILKDEQTLKNIIDLTVFWEQVDNQDKEVFSEIVLKKLYVIKNSPNRMWTFILSVYFLHNKDSDNKLDNNKLYEFIERLIAFTFTYAIVNPGVNALRTPVYPEMISIIESNPLNFKDYKFDESFVRNSINNFKFYNMRPVTKSMLTWWTFECKEQILLSQETEFQIEHIYAKKRMEIENSLKNKENLELLGNKSLLERQINIRAADYKFEDKKRYYEGYITATGQQKKGTEIIDLLELIKKEDNIFDERSILSRNNEIIEKYIEYLREIKLLNQ